MSDKRDFYQDEDINQGRAPSREATLLLHVCLFFFFTFNLFFCFFPKEMQMKFFLYLCNLILTN